MDRFEAIRTLLAAVDGGSLTAASRQLGMPLPTVSRNVSELEARLGTQLVIRTSRKLLLTDAGNAFVVAGRRVLEQLDEAERAAAGEYRTPRGDLLVTAPIMFGKLHVTPVVLSFLAAYPEVNVRVAFFDHVIDLVENHVDVAIRIGHLPDSALVASRIGEIHWVVCASAAYLSTHGTPVAPDDLAEHDCIAFEGLQMVRTWPFGRGTDAKAVAIRPRFAANTADAVIEAAIAGVGIARLTSYQAAGAIREGRLVSLLRRHSPEPIPVHLVHTGPALVPLKIRAFLDFAGPRLKAGLADIADI
ncbi:LysR family transcriptional regulator [Bradyrhizobium sp. Tv2a-2]|uniref:LysR family transcriptional regulator n=1 Tax=Bradyrhizobium sp. Tv2a-2 TaxID=113395 RepID=UPI00040CDC03|nr:LysR family transcriptional regulator [Bradyrhizobium sp. Tv2a-2]